MPKEKKVVVGLELKDKEFLTGLKAIDESVKKVGQNVGKMVTAMGGDFSTLSKAVKNNATAIGVGNKSLTDLKDILKEIRGHLADLKSVVGSTNTILEKMAQTAGRTETGIKRVNESVRKVDSSLDALGKEYKETANAANALEKENEELAQSFDEVATHASKKMVGGLGDASEAYVDFSKQFNKTFSGLKAGKSIVGNMLDTFNPGRIAEAAGWNLSYGIVNAPGKAFRAISAGVKQAVDDTAGLEGELFDLEAYLGGPGGKDLIEFGRQLGAVGSEENLKTAGLTALQNKILQIGQESTFTAREIAAATSAAAKAGVSIFEIAGESGTALDAISLLSQNTGESLESSAEQVSKLQALFETNLNRTQEAMGQTADAGRQYQIIVDGLATADQASASSASQLTEALFNVGGSAANLNISFFETMSLVSQMVPAFESAASAGTSLKYVFSGISGGRSVKAKAAMKQFGLMDDYGQSVFFGANAKTGKTEFKGIEFMTKKLREVFGDDSGMAVDVRNRIITDIFGQDALKAVSRLVSMTDEQAQEMYTMAADMTSNAASGIQAAKSVADIKNEGLEYDLEFFKGTMDSLQKTLAMPLMKPMSNMVQTFSGLGNVAFAIITGAKDVEKQIQDTKANLIDTSLLPGAAALFNAAQKYAYVLKDVLGIITKEGFSIKSISQALATLFGGSANELNQRSAYFKDMLTKLYNGVAQFMENLPQLMERFGRFAIDAFDALAKAFTWLIDNWDSVILGLKIFVGFMVVDQVAAFTNNIIALGSSFGTLYATASKAGGALSGIARMAGEGTEIGKLAKTIGILPAAPAAAVADDVLVAGASAVGTTAAASKLPMLARLTALWTGLSSAVGTAVTSFFSINGLLAAASSALGFLITPLGMALVAVVAFYSAWQNNTAGMATFISEKFGFMWTYISNTVAQIGAVLLPAWEWITNAFSEMSQSTFMDGIANIFKGLVSIIEGALLVVGGVLKVFFGLIQGIFTGNWDLIKSGAMDLLLGVGQMLKGVVAAIVGSIQATVNGVIDAINSVSRMFGWGQIEAIGDKTNKGLSKYLNENGVQSGINFSDGFADGINSGKQKVSKSAYELVKNSALDVVDDTQDAHSRSEETFQDGINFGDGLAQGISSQQGVVSAAASNLASSALSAVDDKFEKAYRSGAQFPFARLSDTYQSIYGAQATASNNVIASQVLNSADVVKSIVDGTYVTPTTTNLGRDMNFGAGAAAYVYQSNAMQQAVAAYKLTDISEQKMIKLLYYSNEFWDTFGQGMERTMTNVEQIVNSRELRLTMPEFGDRADNIVKGFAGDAESWFASNDFRVASQNVKDAAMFGQGTPEYLDQRRYTAIYGKKTTEYSPITEGIIKNFGGKAGEGVNIDPYQWASQLRYQRTTVRYDKMAQEQLNKIAESTEQSSKTSLKFYQTGPGLYDGEWFYTKQGTVDEALRPDQRNLDPRAYAYAVRQLIADKKYDKDLGLILTSVKDFETKNKSFADFGPAAAASIGVLSSEIRNLAASVGAIPNVKGGSMPTEHLDMVSGLPTPAPTTRAYNWDPYNYNEWITRGLRDQTTHAPVNMGEIKVYYTKRKLSPEEMKANAKPLDFVPVTQIPQMSSFFQEGIIPEQYDGEFGKVSPEVAAYKKLYGEEGLEHKGVKDLFEKTPGMLEQYSQIGNRAATFLAMKQGKLSAEDFKTFNELLALDKKDKNNYIAAARKLKQEQNTIWADPTLTQDQKNTKIAKLQNSFLFSQQGLTGSYRDVLGVKVGGMADYEKDVKEGKISEQAKPFVETAFQRIREGYAGALDPKNQSEAFKKLTPEEQQKLKDAVANLPLATSAYYNSAIADGDISDTERQLLEQYSEEDANRIRQIFETGMLPSQADIDAAYAPYVEGTATVTAAGNITGVAAPAWLSGMANIAYAAGVTGGQEYQKGFVEGTLKGPNGETISLANVSVMDALNADPTKVYEQGVKAGKSLPEGIWQGIADGTEVLYEKVTEIYGPPDKEGKRNLIKVIRTAADIKSPSGVWRDYVGLPLIQGVAKGISNNSGLVTAAMKKALGLDGMGAGEMLPSGPGLPADIAGAAPGAQPKGESPFFKSGKTASQQFVKGFVNAEDPINSLYMGIHNPIRRAFNPEGTEPFILDTLLKAKEFGNKIAHTVVDEGFAYVIDGNEEKSWTFGSTIGNALAITTGPDGRGDWYPQAYGLGKEIALGIAAGIADTAAVALIVANAVAAVKAALVAAQGAAKVNSPSLLFAEKIGSPITEGIAHGITESSYMLDSAMGGLMDGATRAYRPDISPIALAGQRQAEINANTYNNYNLGVHTSQNPQVVERSFAVMQSFKG